jgi:hypothetical protein
MYWLPCQLGVANKIKQKLLQYQSTVRLLVSGQQLRWCNRALSDGLVGVGAGGVLFLSMDKIKD